MIQDLHGSSSDCYGWLSWDLFALNRPVRTFSSNSATQQESRLVTNKGADFIDFSPLPSLLSRGDSEGMVVNLI